MTCAGTSTESCGDYSSDEPTDMDTGGSGMTTLTCTCGLGSSMTTGCGGSLRAPEFLQESRMRENLTSGSTRGNWRPGMVLGLTRPTERCGGSLRGL